MLALTVLACGDDGTKSASTPGSGGAMPGGFGGSVGGAAGTVGAGGFTAASGGTVASGGLPGMGGMAMGPGGSVGGPGGTPGSGGAMMPGMGGMGGMAMGPGGSGSGAGGASAGSGGSGAGGADPNDEFAAARQACVDHINMYRATLGLPALSRGTPDQEACSDQGAQMDASTGVPHGSAGDCAGLGAQNTCPGWPGNDVQGSLLRCLDQMWAEGEPPQGVAACIQDRTGCFQMHGHWINMSSSTSQVVACGFYRMPNGSVWMNQNFGR